MSERRATGRWLLLCCALVLGLVAIGGITRLTGSGLSIVEWRPVTGVVPPLDAADWEEAFAAYRRSPEYRHVNAGMSLEAFQRIYWMEYLHRLWGRLVGLAVLAPLAWFLLRRQVRWALARRLVLLLLLGGLQGAAGWYMVRSGLDQVPSVSAVRLTLHLVLGLALFALLFWTALDELRGVRARADARPLSRLAGALVLLSAVTVASGGLVAGTHAGRTYATFPLMAGALVPPGLLVLEPAWRNALENVLTVQFQHRVLALTLAAALLALAVRLRADRSVRGPALAVAAAALLQPSLGVATLLLHVPVALAALHQLGGFLLVTSTLWLTHTLRHPAPGPDALRLTVREASPSHVSPIRYDASSIPGGHT